mmetsp:Transcript_23641/g.66363  ORF Transcript_23641/g.66363 Transcript_23641/m.66363 type:complete len:264 (-) Transcript_23641:358-1149(-)
MALIKDRPRFNSKRSTGHKAATAPNKTFRSKSLRRPFAFINRFTKLLPCSSINLAVSASFDVCWRWAGSTAFISGESRKASTILRVVSRSPIPKTWSWISFARLVIKLFPARFFASAIAPSVSRRSDAAAASFIFPARRSRFISRISSRSARPARTRAASRRRGAGASSSSSGDGVSSSSLLSLSLSFSRPRTSNRIPWTICAAGRSCDLIILMMLSRWWRSTWTSALVSSTMASSRRRPVPLLRRCSGSCGSYTTGGGRLGR